MSIFGIAKKTSTPAPKWSVYIARCANGALYTGMSSNVVRRIIAHNAGKGAKFTRSFRPVKLLWTMVIGNRSAAAKKEFAIKALSRAKKLAIIGGKMAIKKLP